MIDIVQDFQMQYFKEGFSDTCLDGLVMDPTGLQLSHYIEFVVYQMALHDWKNLVNSLEISFTKAISRLQSCLEHQNFLQLVLS